LLRPAPAQAHHAKSCSIPFYGNVTLEKLIYDIL
jgi:hypothetical protein